MAPRFFTYQANLQVPKKGLKLLLNYWTGETNLEFMPRALQFLIGVPIFELSQSELSDYQAYRNFRSQNPYLFSSASLHPNTSFFLNPVLFTLLVFKI